MKDVDQALSEIRSIRNQVARSSEFRGYGPTSIALSGLLAFAVAAYQARVLPPDGTFLGCFGVWVGTAFVAVLLTGIETVSRAQRVHSGLAPEMLRSAIEQFVPALVVGLLLTMVLMRAAPEQGWMLPGLWEVLFSLGIFASCRFLPKQMFGVGVWYLAAGLCCLAACSVTKSFSPWGMGIPFGVGQLLVAAVLYFGFGDECEA
jgi:hypothetical protein